MYYPIKCPYCLKTHTSATVRFYIADTINLSERGAGAESREYASNRLWDEDAKETDAFVPASQVERGLYTLSELEAAFGVKNVKPVYRSVTAIEKLTDSKYDGRLVTGADISLSSDQGLHLTERYCDCGTIDRPRRLDAALGLMPSYVILMMGSSMAGKTVYLVSLYHELTWGGGYSLPPSESPFAKLYLQDITNAEGELSVPEMANRLFETGELPSTTLSMSNEPLALSVSVSMKNGCRRDARIFIRDIAGETLTSLNHPDKAKLIEQFPRFDGFIMLFDPFTFSDNVFKPLLAGQIASAMDEQAEPPGGMPGRQAAKSSETPQEMRINALKSMLARDILPKMDGMVISQPTAAVITKGDYFFDKRVYANLTNRRIDAASHLQPNLRETYDRAYFHSLDKGARDILSLLSPNAQQLCDSFENAAFSLVSSLSMTPIVITPPSGGNDKTPAYVKSPESIKPWRVTIPLIQLLMRFNVIPSFDRLDVLSKPGESERQRAERKRNNRQVINDWGSDYCINWKDEW